ncbi:MAG: DUF302 domain-containing protein [Azonexus sp.]|nr:DUF302 domain-containing protein [Azonexus sp.]
MIYVVASDKSCYEAAVDLEAAALRLGFAVQRAADEGEALRQRGFACDEEWRIVELTSRRLTESLLACDMRLALALPWRIAVFTEAGVTQFGLLQPAALLPEVSAQPETARLAGEFEERLRQVIDEAR